MTFCGSKFDLWETSRMPLSDLNSDSLRKNSETVSTRRDEYLEIAQMRFFTGNYLNISVHKIASHTLLTKAPLCHVLIWETDTILSLILYISSVICLLVNSRSPNEDHWWLFIDLFNSTLHHWYGPKYRAVSWLMNLCTPPLERPGWIWIFMKS